MPSLSYASGLRASISSLPFKGRVSRFERPQVSSFVRRQHSVVNSNQLPRLAHPSLWETIFPKSIRQQSKEFFRPTQKRPTNPASYFIWIYILIGSQAIRILGVKNESNMYIRKADLQIAKLREVVNKLQKGEAVDVERSLGTGDESEEQEWENALREIENEDRAWQQSKHQEEEERRKMHDEQIKYEAERRDASPVNQSTTQAYDAHINSGAPNSPGFY